MSGWVSLACFAVLGAIICGITWLACYAAKQHLVVDTDRQRLTMALAGFLWSIVATTGLALMARFRDTGLTASVPADASDLGLTVLFVLVNATVLTVALQG